MNLSLEGWLPFSRDFFKLHPPPLVLGLQGELGAGKTTATRIIVQFFSDSSVTVKSPTFVFRHSYHLKIPIEHFDLYRLEEPTQQDLEEIGYFDALKKIREEKGLLLVEWPDRVMPLDLLELDFLWRIEITDVANRMLHLVKLSKTR